jgi:hypothetical protein
MVHRQFINDNLSYRFGDNFGLFKDDRGLFWVVWVIDFESENDKPGLDDEITIVGHRFRKKKSGGVSARGFCMSNLYSFIVWDLEVENTVRFRKDQLVGKGSCLYQRQDREPGRTNESDYKTPRAGTTWRFELLDHCIDYGSLRPRGVLSPDRPTRRKRKRSVVIREDSDESD